MAELSEYEKLRLERVKSNELFLQELDMSEDMATLQSRAEKKKKKPMVVNSKRKTVDPTLPRRRSGRVRGKEPDSLYIQDMRGGKVFVSSMPATMHNKAAGKEGVQVFTFDPKEEVRRTRFEEQMLELGLDAENIDKGGEEFFKTLEKQQKQSVSNKSKTVKMELGVSATFAKLRCDESYKVCPQRGYSVALHAQTMLAVAGDKEGNIGMLRLGIEDPEDDSAFVEFKPHTGTVNVLDLTGTKMTSASYDGTVRQMDLGRPGSFELLYSTDNKTKSNWLQHATFNAQRTHLCVGDSDGHVTYRNVGGKRDSKSEEWSFQAHDKKVQTVSLSPDERLLVTASLERSVRLWDLRKLPTASSKSSLKNCVAHFEDSHSVSACLFNPVGDKLVAVGMSNNIHLFDDVSKLKGKVLPSHSLRHDNQTGRYLAVFHPSWDPKRPNVFSCGSMLQPRRLEIFQASKEGKIKLTMNLMGDGVTSVQSRHCFHPTLEMVASINASGRLHIFQSK